MVLHTFHIAIVSKAPHVMSILCMSRCSEAGHTDFLRILGKSVLPDSCCDVLQHYEIQPIPYRVPAIVARHRYCVRLGNLKGSLSLQSYCSKGYSYCVFCSSKTTNANALPFKILKRTQLKTPNGGEI